MSDNTAPRKILLTAIAMLAFAGNSLLCRLALSHTEIDAASFSAIRLLSGALILLPVMILTSKQQSLPGSWKGASALFIYALTFSLAYLSLPAATGALLMTGSVQLTMMGFSLWNGEVLGYRQWFGFILAAAGVGVLFLPEASAPSLQGAFLMCLSGLAWGAYSVMGKASQKPLVSTAGNFLRTIPMVLIMLVVMPEYLVLDKLGVLYALLSGILASAAGYIIWYCVLPLHTFASASIAHLSVPVITAFAGVPLLDESINLKLVIASLAVIAGIGLFIAKQKNELAGQTTE